MYIHIHIHNAHLQENPIQNWAAHIHTRFMDNTCTRVHAEKHFHGVVSSSTQNASKSFTKYFLLYDASG